MAQDLDELRKIGYTMKDYQSKSDLCHDLPIPPCLPTQAIVAPDAFKSFTLAGSAAALAVSRLIPVTLLVQQNVSSIFSQTSTV